MTTQPKSPPVPSDRCLVRLACLVAVLFWVALPSCFADAQFPSDPSLPLKFGVFIGINKYRNLPQEDQLDGCVDDAMALQKLFADSFNVRRSILLTDDQATRRGIGQALDELVRQVKAARALTQAPIDVVITYSGHGTKVMRLATENDPNALDNAWVASDSTASFDQVVRGHELLQVHTALANLNAQVLIISDSCYSGSGYRGIESAKARCILDGAQSPAGPQDQLFPDLQIDPSLPAPAAQTAGQPLPGFVYYSACSDNEEAREYTDPQSDQTWGRLTFTLSTLLREHDPELTYDELAAKVTVRFASLWPNQHPEFHAAPGKGGDLFLHAGPRPPLNARILNNNPDGTLELSLGSLDGVMKTSHFRLYSSLDDLVNHAAPIASATVSNLTPVSCTVTLEAPASIPADARAAMDEVRMTDFVVGFDGDVPQPIRRKIQEMDNNNQVSLAAPGNPYTIAIHYLPQKQAVGFYLPSALPGGKIEPKPLRLVGYTSPSDAEIVADNLLYIARVQRLMTLKQEGTDPLVTAQIEPQGPLSPATQPADGLVHMRQGSQLVIKLTNQSSESPLYFWVFVVGNDGELDTLYPTGGETQPIAPKASLEIGRTRTLTASIDQNDLPSGAAEMTTLKVIATTSYVDLQSLTIAPSTNMQQSSARGVGGPENPLLNILKNATQGGGARGLEVLPNDTVWDTADTALDVIKN